MKKILIIIMMLMFTGCVVQTEMEIKTEPTEKITGETFKIESQFVRSDGKSLYRSEEITKFKIGRDVCYSRSYGGLWCRTIRLGE